MISEIISFKNSLPCGDKLFRTQHPCAKLFSLTPRHHLYLFICHFIVQPLNTEIFFSKHFIASLCYSAPFSDDLQTASAPEFPVRLLLPLSASQVIYLRTTLFSSLLATSVKHLANHIQGK